MYSFFSPQSSALEYDPLVAALRARTYAPLGQPLPPLPHAVSVSMPKWNDVVRYEEGDPRVHAALTCGYPRFVLHPYVRALAKAAQSRFARDDESVFVFPSRRVAQRAAAYLKTSRDISARICSLEKEDLHAVVSAAPGGTLLKEFWQHGGEIVSSRRAQAALQGESEPGAGAQAKARLRLRLAEWYGTSPADVFLYASGMAAIFGAFRLALKRRPGRKTVQLGFPYLDTLRIQQRFGSGMHFIGVGAGNEVEELRAILAREEIAAVFTEVPANPLLRTPRLEEISRLLRAAGVPLIVDDTLGTPFNVKVTPFADLVATSLTKFVSGKGNVIAGALQLSGESALADELREPLHRDFEDLLWGDDALVLEANSRDVAARVAQSSRTARAAAQLLREHPFVERVFYPEFETRAAYDALRTPDGGYGAVFSLVLKNAPRKAPRFYDALRCAKGPGLGTDFTLACPYTVLTHYGEPEWAEEREVSRWLVRVSVGVESIEELSDTLIEALAYSGEGVS